MEGFAEMVREELMATAPPRRVVFRTLSDSWREWALIFLFLVLSAFFGYWSLKVTAICLAVDHGISVTAQVTDHSTSARKGGGKNYYLQVSFPDQDGRQQASEVQVVRQDFENHPNGATLEVHYLQGLTCWSVSDQCQPAPHAIYGGVFFLLLAVVFFFLPLMILFNEFQLFRNGRFVEGSIADIQEDRRGYDKIKVEYFLDGEPRVSVVRMKNLDSTVEKVAAVAVMPGKNGKARIFFNVSSGTVFQVKVPDSFYSN